MFASFWWRGDLNRVRDLYVRINRSDLPHPAVRKSGVRVLLSCGRRDHGHHL